MSRNIVRIYKILVTFICMYILIQPIKVYGEELEDNFLENNMQISASIEDNSASYIVTIPVSVSMGKVSKYTDNVREYEITIKNKTKNGKITVSALESGELINCENILLFTNDFGEQSFVADEDMTEKTLTGAIHISQDDVKNVPAGTYSGSTTFTIKYEENKTNNSGNIQTGTNLNGGSTLNNGSSLKNNEVLGSLLTNNTLKNNLNNNLLGGLGINTGDDNNVLLWIMVTSVSALIMIGIIIDMKFNEYREKKMKGTIKNDTSKRS